MPEFGLSKKDRIRLQKDFERIKERGKRFRTEHFLVNYLIKDEQTIRLAAVVSSKIKKAVKRNRAKRLIREFFRLNRKKIKALFSSALARDSFGIDIIFVAYPGAEELKYQEVEKELWKGFEKEAERLKDAEEAGSDCN